MTVKEIKTFLEDFDDNLEVIFRKYDGDDDMYTYYSENEIEEDDFYVAELHGKEYLIIGD